MPAMWANAARPVQADGDSMTVTEYVILFVLVAIMGAGLPGPGDASLIAAGTLAGKAG